MLVILEVSHRSAEQDQQRQWQQKQWQQKQWQQSYEKTVQEQELEKSMALEAELVQKHVEVNWIPTQPESTSRYHS